jgi:hypothetical protein
MGISFLNHYRFKETGMGMVGPSPREGVRRLHAPGRKPANRLVRVEAVLNRSGWGETRASEVSRDEEKVGRVEGSEQRLPAGKSNEWITGKVTRGTAGLQADFKKT